MTRPTIIEKTEQDVLIQYTEKFFKRVHASSPVLDSSFAGKHICIAAIVTDYEPTEPEMDGFEQLIIAQGGADGYVMIGPVRIPIDRVPDGYDLTLGIEAGLNITPTPEPEVI